jgi:hypothetical protein
MSSQTIITLTGDEKSAYEAFKRIIDQESKAALKAKELGAAANKAGTELAGMKNPNLDAKTVRMSKEELEALRLATKRAKEEGQKPGWFNVNTMPILQTISVLGALKAAIDVTTAAWSLYQERMKNALDSQKDVQPSETRLIQVAQDKDDLDRLIKRADDAALASGVDRKTARSILFSARSEGFESAYEALLASSAVVSPEAQAVVAGKLPTIFNQAIQPVEAVSMTLKAAQASNLSFEQLGAVAPTAAEGAALLGAGPEETLGVLSVLSARFKSAETAADRIKGFSASLGINPEFQGLGILGSYNKLAQLPEEERSQVLGKSQELNVAFNLIGKALPDIEQRIKDLEAERQDYQSGGGLLRRQNELAMSNQSTRQVVDINRAKVFREIEIEQRLAEEATLQEVARLESDALAEKKDAGMLNRLVTSWASPFVSSVAPKEISSRERAMMANTIGDTVVPETLLPGLLGPVGSLFHNHEKTIAKTMEIAQEANSRTEAISRSFSSEYSSDTPQVTPTRQATPSPNNNSREVRTFFAALADSLGPSLFGPLGNQQVSNPRGMLNTTVNLIRTEPNVPISPVELPPLILEPDYFPPLGTGLIEPREESIQDRTNQSGTNPAKADPQLLKQLEQANELARTQTDLVIRQNEILQRLATAQERNMDTEPSNTTGTIQAQQQIRR